MPSSTLAGADGVVDPVFVWAALDCPGALGIAGGQMRPALLGTLQGSLRRAVLTDEPYIVIGWKIGTRGRKHVAGSAVFTTEAKPCDSARAIWIEI